MSVPMELEVWDGDWGLPSIDISCLQVMVYCKISGAPVITKVKNNPFRRVLPTFRHGKKTLSDFQDVAAHLKTENFDLDHFLSKKNCSDIQAFSQLLKEKLYPAIQFVWWVDNKNYVTLTRPWYAKKLPFPFNYYYPGKYEAHAKDLISCLYGSLEENYVMVENKVYGDAEKCLTLLSNKLGDSEYFFGTQPSSLDAIVFSYLAPLLKAPFQNQALQNHLKACTNLVNFVDTVIEKYYSSLIHEYRKKTIRLQELGADGILKHNLKHQILACFIAVVAMVAYMAIAPAFIRRNIKFENFFLEAEEEEVD